MTGTVGFGRSSRRDALRNDERVFEAARAALREIGPQASMEQIAARGGVAMGTVYRRFGSKDALLDALVELVFEELNAAAAAALEGDDGTGLASFLRMLGETLFEHRRYASLLVGRGAAPVGKARLQDQLRQLSANAVDAGTVNGSVSGDDILALSSALIAIIGSVGDAGDDNPEAWRRFLGWHLAGLRSGIPEAAQPRSARSSTNR